MDLSQNNAQTFDQASPLNLSTKFERAPYLKSGAEFSLLGKPFSLLVFPDSAVALLKPSGVTDGEFQSLFQLTGFCKEKLAPPIQRMADRLVDAYDGLQTKGIAAITDFLGAAPPELAERALPYFIFIARNGSSFHHSHSAVYRRLFPKMSSQHSLPLCQRLVFPEQKKNI